MTSVSWMPERLTITLTSEPTARIVSLGLCGIDVGLHGELRTAELLLLRPRLGVFASFREAADARAAPKSPYDLNREISAAAKKETPVVNTMIELRKSLASLKDGMCQ